MRVTKIKKLKVKKLIMEYLKICDDREPYVEY